MAAEESQRQQRLPGGFRIRSATVGDTPVIHRFIHALAAYERLSQECVATEEGLRATVFGESPAAEVVLGEWDGTPVGMALFFTNYSTFLARPGIYMEDLFVLPEFRGRGFGKALLLHVGRLARQRGCGRFDWAVLKWNTPSIEFYRSLGAVPLDEWTVMRLAGDALARLPDPGEPTKS
ncbi:MAG: GNAT family N-acetyltransferase [Verrucomicrobiae bacterium]|nr:GNAT family N-acetyltransferase [Verrucomicrobiae bacterium]